MARVLDATCASGAVSVGGVVVAGVTILSEGVASSTGYLILDQDRKYYVAKTHGDVKTLIDSVTDLLQDMSDLVQLVTTGLTGSTSAVPPTFVATKAQLDAAIATLKATKDSLK